ncbi:hypothetical protein [Enterococcus faecium]|uniref:Uncharacterized protein n=1 Tax=Enterococcus faecium TaxID=1352 RepID=A0A242AZY3_ENTFC|nr:hypothetical protein [Enterococcus faecium]OTN86631.1 hypothetical protein A5810_003029 [Enterococcus faecium]
MWRLLFFVVCCMVLVYSYRVYLYPRMERVTRWYRDPLRQQKGHKRYRYELLVEFSDGRQAQYCFFANYPAYNTSELLVELFKNNVYIGLEENGQQFLYRSSHVHAASMNKTRII